MLLLHHHNDSLWFLLKVCVNYLFGTQIQDFVALPNCYQIPSVAFECGLEIKLEYDSTEWSLMGGPWGLRFGIQILGFKL
jgi:hypothetical protein